MPIYSVDVKIYATAYIRAESSEAALEIARGLKNTGFELPEGFHGVTGWGGIEISGRSFDDPELPDVSLSPAMTIHGPDADAVCDLAE